MRSIKSYVDRYMTDLTVDVADHRLTAAWTDENPETSSALAEALPVEGAATRWGDELYFSVPVDVPAENVREEVPVGAVARLEDVTPLRSLDGGTHVTVST